MPDNDAGGRILVNGEALSQKAVRAGGGGEKHHPQTLAQAQQHLAPQLSVVRDVLAAIPERLRAERVVIEAEVWANYLANSYFPEDLVKQLKLRPLGSKIVERGIQHLPSTGETEAVSKSFLLSADATAVQGMQAILAGAGGTKGAADDLRQFTKISVSTAHRSTIEADARELVSFEAVLHPDPDDSSVNERAAASAPTLTKFVALVESVGGRVHLEDNDVVDGLTFVAVELPPAKVDEVASFNPLRSLTPAPRVVLMEDDLVDDSDEDLIAAPAAVPGAPEVLVFDGGVDDTGTMFAGHVTSVDLTTNGHNPRSALHGSAVTAAILYGDIANTGVVPQPAARVTHYQITPGPKEDASEFPWVLRQIRQVVETTEARIVNLSVGPQAPVEDREPHRWTAVLDKIAYNRQILFVTAAGNNGESDAATGLNRVQSPADMVNGLCVGASDTPASETDWNAATYSGRGPGRPGARTQPAVMAFGGTKTRRFGRVRPNGQVVHDHEGTSYAAPLVTNVLSKIAAQLAGRSDANTLRALAVHFAENTEGHPVFEVGHGRLAHDVDGLLTCPPHEVTVIYQGVLKRDEVRAYPLPVPSTLTKGMVDVRWSLALSTATDSAEAGEYSKAGLEVKFRPHDQVYSMRRTKPGTNKDETKIVRITDAAHVAQMLATGWKISQNPVTRQPKRSSRSEAAKREQGKWESLWRADSSMRASSLRQPRIDINHLTREGGRITTGTDDVEFSLVVTISSRAGVPIYADVQNEFSVLTALPVLAPVRVNVADVDTNITV
ncbi:S8 family peptidase [Plantibacter sp. MCCC 1A11337]|uniref:S8 family peptidase n=1 Tax=Plantibacter sp. MCCC 1A11337 TaxID=2736644 RepID=UPI001582505B|nr:S8 family peptidase [Plantibacter sp. MCCC 1A11337]NUJ89173.1 S8 family peptidase [Plantibacter sp. MCCC 1A11337]